MHDFVIGEWTVLPDRNSIRRGGALVRLEPRVMDLLVYLSEHPDEVLSVDQIINDVWPHAFVTKGVLLTAISNLRRALGDDRKRPLYIETIPKRGYRLVANSSAAAHVLAVLPIGIESGGTELSFLAEGLTASLTERLGTIPAMRVIARSSVVAIGGSARHIPAMARELGASMVLSAVLSLEEHDRLTITYRLINVDEDRTLLNERRTRPKAELLELEREIVQSVADRIADRLRSGPSARQRQAHPDAIIECMRARFHYYRQSPEHFAKSLEHFERALRIDPLCAQAHVGVADVWGAYAYWGARDAREMRDRILKHVRIAIEIDADDPGALVLQASACMYFEHDWGSAARKLRRALAINPNLCHTRLVNALLLGTLRDRQALDEINRAFRIDPLNPAVILVRSLIESSVGNHDAALADVRELLSIDPAHPPGLRLRSELSWRAGSPDAIEHEREVWQSDRPIRAALYDGHDSGALLEQAARALVQRSADTYVAPYEIARMLTLAGRIEAALDCIEHALAIGDFMRIDFLQLSPAFSMLRSHERYRGLAARLGIQA